jgi:hypothetical protein
VNYYEDKPRYWRSCALWTEEEVKFLLSGIWPDEGESAPNSLACTVIEIPKVETLCSTNERGIKELLEIHETETVLVCPVPDTVTLSQLIGDAVSAGLLTPVPFAGQVRYAHHLVNKFRPDDVIRWANRRGCFPDFPFCTDYQAVEPNTEPTSQTLLDRQAKDPAAKPGTYEAEPEVPSPQAMTALQAEANVMEAKAVAVVNVGGGDAKLAPSAGRGWVMKRAALIKKYEPQWETIKRDFQDASENGLSRAAKAPGHGDWFENDILNWARQRGKLSEETGQPVPSLATPFSGLTHRIRR